MQLCLGEFCLDLRDKEEENERGTEFHSPRSWMPPKGRDASLEAHIIGLRKNVEEQLKRLQTEKRMALKNLHKCKDIIAKPADKGSLWPCLAKTII